MKKIVFGILVLILMINVSAFVKGNDFKEFDIINETGTYAVSENQILVELVFKTDVQIVLDNLKLVDILDANIPLGTITVLDDIGGRATRFRIDLVTPLDKTKIYFLKLNEYSIQVDMDNNKALISFTNKVYNDSLKYDEKLDIYYVEMISENIFEKVFSKKQEFDLEPYIRLNVVDDRDGSLLDQTNISNLPDLYEAGTYEVTISAIDSWGNEALKVFTFEVIDNTSNGDMLVNIFTGVGVVSLIAGGLFIFKKFMK